MTNKQSDIGKGERAIGRVLKVGTRGSQLALKQTGIVMEELRKRHSGLTLDVHVIKTTGDRMQDVSLAQIGGKGAFVKELEEALLERRIDLAIHSMKDVPALLPEGLVIAAMLEREDPRDVLISKGNFKLERIPREGPDRHGVAAAGLAAEEHSTWTWRSFPSGETWTRGSKRSSGKTSTGSSWRRRDSSGWDGRTGPPSTSPRRS
ncbi:MAG: hypothetical protein MZV70_75520 [Desulfobacterales bacterium]|nr:hypothetical protein [Desulfobacterales bacterium]